MNTTTGEMTDAAKVELLTEALKKVHEGLMLEAKHLDGRLLNLVTQVIDPALRKTGR